MGTPGMFWFYLFLIIWIPVALGLLGHDIWQHWKKPWLEARRTEGMISLSKTQQYLVMGFWPFAIVGLIGWFVFGTLRLIVQDLMIKWRGLKH